MRIIVDLLWVRPGKNGGTESVIRNLLFGFGMYDNNNTYVLLTAKDNYESFSEYKKFKNCEFVICNVMSQKKIYRLIWQKLFLVKQISKYNCDLYFSPIYSIPGKMKIPIVAVIHDLQALHYPEYFSWFRNQYMYFSWWMTCRNASKIITISEFCKKDIVENLPVNDNKLTVIYNPVMPSKEIDEFGNIAKKFKIQKNKYYYTVSHLAKHKNLITLLEAFKKLVEQGDETKMVITGIEANAENEVLKFIKKNRLQNKVIFTGYVSSGERDELYKNCKIFLYPSIFEGFGMPPIEAMKLGATTIVSNAACLKEVTQGKAIYVEKPMDINEWIQKIYLSTKMKKEICAFECYDLFPITRKYIETFESVLK